MAAVSAIPTSAQNQMVSGLGPTVAPTATSVWPISVSVKTSTLGVSHMMTG